MDRQEILTEIGNKLGLKYSFAEFAGAHGSVRYLEIEIEIKTEDFGNFVHTIATIELTGDGTSVRVAKVDKERKHKLISAARDSKIYSLSDPDIFNKLKEYINAK